MKVMFRVDRASIERREVERETKLFVYWPTPNHEGIIFEHSERKVSLEATWHHSWASAYAHLVGLHRKRVDDLRGQLLEAEDAVERVRAMKEPG